MTTSLAEAPRLILVNVCAIAVSGMGWNVNHYLKGRPFKARPAYSRGQKPNQDSSEQTLSRFGDCRLSRRMDRDDCLMIDVRVIHV
jgi:hypothetical protein